MKKLSFIALVFIFASVQLWAQSPKEVFQASEVTWFGLDFSKAKFLGSFSQFGEAGSKNGEQIKDVYFKGWNNLIINESKKYNLEEAFHKSKVPYDLSIVEKRNETVNPDKLFSTNSDDKNKITPEAIADMIKDYKTDKKGTGLVFIVDNFDKPSEEAVIHVTFFDMGSRKVLLTQKMTGTPRGFGIRNYWAGAIAKILHNCEKEYPNWEQQYK